MADTMVIIVKRSLQRLQTVVLHQQLSSTLHVPRRSRLESALSLGKKP